MLKLFLAQIFASRENYLLINIININALFWTRNKYGHQIHINGTYNIVQGHIWGKYVRICVTVFPKIFYGHSNFKISNSIPNYLVQIQMSLVLNHRK